MVTATPIWLDCDTGHDDALAILVAAQHVGGQLLGISTTYGNASLANTTYNTRAILKSIGREDIPVYPGVPRPLYRPVEDSYAADIHGGSGLDGTTKLKEPTVPPRTDITAIDAIYEAVRKTAPQTAWIIATGPLTNMALLFATYPDLVKHIAGLSIMGGALNITGKVPPAEKGQPYVDRVGNWTPWAEYNIYCDPESARAIFDNKLLAGKTILIPLDLTHGFLATKEVTAKLLKSKLRDKRPEVRILFYEILKYFGDTYRDAFGFWDGPPVHDVLAVGAFLANDLFTYRTGDLVLDIQVVTDGEHGASKEIRESDSQCGRTIAFHRDASTGPGVRVPWQVDTEAMWEVIDDCLTLSEACVAATDGKQKKGRGGPFALTYDGEIIQPTDGGSA